MADSTMAESNVEYSKLTVSQLKEKLEERGLETSGKKAELVSRLVEADNDNLVSPQDSVSQHGSVKSTDSKSTKASTKSSSTSSAKIKAAVKRAALEAKMCFLQQEQELRMRMERDKLMLESQLREQELECEMEKQRLDLEEKRHRLKGETEMKERLLQMQLGVERLRLEAEVHASVAEENVLTQAMEGSAVQAESTGTFVPASKNVDPNPQGQGQSVKPRSSADSIFKVMKSTLNPKAGEWHPTNVTLADREDTDNPLLKIVLQQQKQIQQQSQNIEACLSVIHERKASNTRDTSVAHSNEFELTSEEERKAGNVHKLTSSPYSHVDPGNVTQLHLLEAINLPRTSLMKFDGDSMNFWIFMNSFDACVGNTSASSGAKLNRLFEYCTGKAAKVIKCCALMNPEEGYVKARSILKERFGNEYQISEAWIRKVTEGSAIRSNNANDLQDFADDVRSCIETLRVMHKLDELDSRVRMVKIVERLPLHLQARWRKEAVDTLEKTNKYPNIERLDVFLSKAAKEANDPVFGVLHDHRSKTSQGKSKSKGSSFSVKATNSSSHSAATDEAVAVNHDKDDKKSEIKRVCPMCDKDHLLYACAKFKEMSPEKRLEVVNEKHICFNCLKKGKHTSRFCRFRNVCGIDGCTWKHSKLLHEALSKLPKSSSKVDPVSVEANSCACGPSKAETTKVALPIVAVRVNGAGKDGSVLTYALLDPGSNKTFCTQSLVKKLGVKGEQVTLTLSTLNDGKRSNVELVSLEVRGTRQHGKKVVKLQNVHAIEKFPCLTSSIASQDDVAMWKHLKDIEVPMANAEVEILIGQDNPQVLMPLEVRRCGEDEPYAVRSCLGWMINGPITSNNTATQPSLCHFVHAARQPDDALEDQVEKFWKIDSAQLANSLPQMSQEDHQVVEIWNSSLTTENGHYQMKIPFMRNPPELPDNKYVAEKRLQSLRKRFSRQPGLHEKYLAEIENLIEKGYAEHVAEEKAEGPPGRTWYLPHHNVVNPNKPEKTRIVFDCAAEYSGVSLNKKVLQGPDLTNKLLGVLLRFREHPIAVMGDIEAMFHQVKVDPEDRDALRFLWWPKGDMSKPAEIYRMTVHLFGGVWSPSCASFAVRRTAEDHASEFDPDIINTVLENFYVDDCLKSVDSEEKAMWLVTELCKLLSKGGFRLTKWVSNSKKVMETIPEQERAKDVKDLSLPLPVERALGVQWITSADVFSIKVSPKEGPVTRRGLLSIMSSVYDPIGLVSPFILQAKKIFQCECKTGKGWDEELETDNAKRWLKWLEDLPIIQEFKVERCIAPQDFGKVTEAQLHHFCDASEEAYGAVSYARLSNEEGQIHCAFLMSKSRLAPIKRMTIPRLELMGAVTAIQMDAILRRELRIRLKESIFWTDSMIVLQYVKNTKIRLQTFVANRVAMIRDGSQPHQWNHIDSKANPADDASRGLDAKQMLANVGWLKGPSFLRDDASEWPEIPDIPSDLPMDAEVKKEVKSCAAHADQHSDIFDQMLKRYSCWFRMKKAVAWLLRYKTWLRNQKNAKQGSIEVQELREAEEVIVKHLQACFYQQEVDDLNHKAAVSKTSSIRALEPVKDSSGILRVGGRLQHAPMSDEAKHPIILPSDHHVTALIIRHAHVCSGHSGREYVLAQLRQKYWIPKINSERSIHKCWSRLFWPFPRQEGRSQEKRYRCLFTCLSMRAIHIEVLRSLEADSFINSLVRFTARRGVPEKIRSDNGTNFVGSQRELKQAVEEWNVNNKTKKHLLLKDIVWEFNPPYASHMGGVWERQIRTVRRVLNAVMRNQVLDDERLTTLFCEVECIVNGRPITTVSDDPKDMEPLTPNHLLLLRGGPSAPPGIFTKADVYRRRWRHVQYLSDMFWKRWLKEYLPSIQLRQKWLEPKRNIAVGDIVLVMNENTPRKAWPMGRITQTFPGRDGLVRSAELRTQHNILTRPVHKLCLLEGINVDSFASK